MSTTQRPLPDGTTLRNRFATLRRRLRLVATWRGAAWLAALALGVFVVFGTVDYFYPLFPLVRAVALAATLTTAGIIAWRQLLVPLAQPMDDLSLALRVEDRHPTLNDALGSTVQFLEQSAGPEGESAGMKHEAVRRTLGRVTGLDFNRIVDARGLRKATAAAGTLAAVAIIAALTYPELAATAFWRFTMPFSSAQWPKRTGIELDSFARRIGRGREYRVTGTVKGVVPKEGTIELAFEGLPPSRRPFTIREDNEGIARFLVHLRPEEVQRNFSFRLYANDAETARHGVEVLPLPQLAAIDNNHSPQVTLYPPKYTDLPSPQRLSPGHGAIDSVYGTMVTLRAAADRPLRRAWITFEPEAREALVTLAVAPLGSPDALGVLGSIALARSVLVPVEGVLSTDRRQFSVTFLPPAHGAYTLHFEDDNELENFRQYELRIRPDPSPVVKLDRPSATRDVLSVLPTAEVPLSLAVEDVLYAVRSVWLEYRVGPEEPVQIMPLFDAAKGLAVEASGWLGPHARAMPIPRLRLQRVEAIRRLAVARLRHADGRPPREGDVILLQACADDFDNVTPFKEPARSHVVEIRIVGRSAVQDIVRQKEGEIQNELAKAREKQREAMARVQEMENRLKKDGKAMPEREAQKAEADAQKEQDAAVAEEEKADATKDEAKKQEHKDKAEKHRKKAAELTREAEELKRQAAQMAEAMEMQAQVRERINNEKDGLRSEIEKLRETLRQNGMENSSAMERMAQLQRELDRLAEKELEQIEPKLAAARKMAELQDEATRKERMAELEEKARREEKEAATALSRAGKLDESASRAEKAAGMAEGEEKARLEKDAKRNRAEAMAQRERAAELLEQAKKDREDARKPFDPKQARQAMADARKDQEEVDRTLSAMLQDLEPAGSTRDVKNEAARLRKEQQEAMAQLEELEKKGLTGKNPEELKPEELAQLEEAAETQKKLEERTRQLLDKMKAVAEARAEKDPETAREIDNARKEAEEGKLAETMKEAAEAIKKNKLNEAARKQREAMAELEKLAKNLEEKRDAELDRLIKKLKEAEAEAEKLLDEQERLAKKMREAAKDPEELKKLAKEQEKLQGRTQKLMQEMARLRKQRAGQAVGDAEEEMKEAVKKLSRGERDPEQQEDVLDRLEEARREIEKARKKAEEELGREQLARIADTLKALRERQQGHVDEARRIQENVQGRMGWTRGLTASMGSLGRNQKGLGDETGSVARKELAGSPIFAQLLKQVARDMEKAAERAAALSRESPEAALLPDRELDLHQQSALRKLNQLLDAIKEQQQTDPRPIKGGGGEEPGGAGGGGGGDGLPPLAQLKLLRAMQDEVNKKTEDFRKRYPEIEGIPPRAKAELDELRKEQKEVGDLLDRLASPPMEPDDEDKKPEDKKPEGKKNEKKEGK